MKPTFSVLSEVVGGGRRGILLILILAVFSATGCRQPAQTESVGVTTTTPRVSDSVTPPPAATDERAGSTGTSVAPSRTPTPTAAVVPSLTATPHPLFLYTIAGLRQRDFPGGQIQVRTILERNNDFTQSYIQYPSEGLSITGLMYTPLGEGPFPILVLLHGYIDRDRYYAGADTWQAAEFFVRRGYLVLVPDLRSWGESDTGLSLFHTGLVADVLNLISSLPSLPEANQNRVGLWGHSMGGGIATKVLTVDSRVRAAVLYAPNSADDADLIARWGPGCLPGQSQAVGDDCNPAEIIPADIPPDIIEAYLTAVRQPDFLRRVAPLYHLDAVTAPIQIHIGTADGQSLVETPPDWSAKLAESLRAADQDVTYFTYPGQGHAFLGESWTMLLDRALGFFDAHLKGEPGSS